MRSAFGIEHISKGLPSALKAGRSATVYGANRQIANKMGQYHATLHPNTYGRKIKGPVAGMEAKNVARGSLKRLTPATKQNVSRQGKRELP